MADWRTQECVLHEMMGCVTCSPTRRAERRMRRSGGGSAGEASVEFGVGVVLLECPYNAEFVADLKAAVPVGHRRWLSEQRVWEISDEFWDHAESLVEDYFVLV